MTLLEQLQSDPRTSPYVGAVMPMLPVLFRLTKERATELFAELVAGDSEAALLEIRREADEGEWATIADEVIESGKLEAIRAVDDRDEAAAAATKVLWSVLSIVLGAIP